ncbi:uncharacterized protein TRAVEDRAFT_50997 [Trametes versicolor FP-101664 SS1]|uniref:uncharacterized protein n=1 Tax=Trametes versicolor (strain FP-101664) TaxID=717944 RepID=UPI00046223EC|nr:uncharacterized protein TRAVEDRAFT_50997 [Trametes versicolor FP-101664 SS1]EIW54861.1 hypothetical protein TRAVEDRAFT_50997 [Trametes versicolor FP-101664 SS1]
MKQQAQFLRDPVPSDFSRFTIYSIRIKKIGYDQDTCPLGSTQNCMLGFDIWDALLLHGPKPLLPSIRSLFHSEEKFRAERNHVEVDSFEASPLLFGPELREVDLRVPEIRAVYPEHRPAELVKQLALAAPLLERLTLQAHRLWHLPGTKSSCLSGSGIGEFRRLVYFSGHSIHVDPEALLALGSLPSLRDIRLHVDSQKYAWDALPHERHSKELFPGLTKLDLYYTDFDWCSAFLRVATPTSLQTLWITDERAVVPALQLEGLCASIGDLPCAHSLRELIITTGRNLSNMERVVCHPRRIAPLLVPSLSGLRRIKFPRIMVLALALDMRVVPELATRLPSAPRACELHASASLKQLFAVGSVPRDPLRFAAFLCATFPQLEAVQCYADLRGQVEWYHRRLVIVRQQERKWALAHGRNL